MPAVGLFTTTEPLAKQTHVILRYTVEVGGHAIYNESYDLDTLAVELEMDEAKALRLWARRLKCAVAARHRNGFSAALTRCLADGECCDLGSHNCAQVDDLSHP